MDHSSFAGYIQPLLRAYKMPERTLDYEAKKKLLSSLSNWAAATHLWVSADLTACLLHTGYYYNF